MRTEEEMTVNKETEEKRRQGETVQKSGKYKGKPLEYYRENMKLFED